MSFTNFFLFLSFFSTVVETSSNLGSLFFSICSKHNFFWTSKALIQKFSCFFMYSLSESLRLSLLALMLHPSNQSCKSSKLSAKYSVSWSFKIYPCWKNYDSDKIYIISYQYLFLHFSMQNNNVYILVLYLTLFFLIFLYFS